jgi:HEAT repeat protein
MSIKEKIENNAAVFLLGALVTGFLAGIGAYQAILEIAKLKVVHESKLGSGSSDDQVIEIVNQFIGDFNNEAVDEDMVEYALLKIGEPAVKPLIDALNSKENEESVREKAAYLLGEMKADSALEDLEKALRKDEPYVRKLAAEALGKIGGDTAIRYLQKALENESSYAREGAAYALGKMKAYGTENDLEKVLLKDKDPDVRAKATKALGELQYFQGESYFIELLNDRNADLKASAIFALGQIKCKKALNAIIAALKDPNRRVRYEAARALGEIGDSSAIAPLKELLSKELLSDKNNYLMEYSIKGSLRKIGER